MSIELELAHYGVKGMKWGTRKRHAVMAGKMAAEAGLATTHPSRKTRAFGRNLRENLDNQWHSPEWRGHKYVNTYEKSKQKSYRRKVRWSGNSRGAVDAAKKYGDTKTKAIARKEAKHPNRWKVRRTAAAVLAVSGVVAYSYARTDHAHATGQAVYNKIRKTSIDGIRSAARMAAEYERKKGR